MLQTLFMNNQFRSSAVPQFRSSAVPQFRSLKAQGVGRAMSFEALAK